MENFSYCKSAKGITLFKAVPNRVKYHMRIFVSPETIAERTGIRLPTEKSHYLQSVLRLVEGDTLEVIDGKGKAYKAVISSIRKRDVHLDITSELPVDAESAARIILCQGILKGEKMDLVVQKATELGAAEIIPLITERCLVKKTRKVGRWEKIAEEAAEQCGRAVIPTVHEPVPLNELSRRGRMDGFVFWEGGGSPLSGADPARETVYLLVGPEGGFTTAEVKTAEDYGLVRTTLGKRILRADTAAIVAVALLQFMTEHPANIY